MKKLLKRLFIGIAGIALLANLVILFSGKWYIYTAVMKTYVIGQGGPGIYDLNLFPERTIHAAKKALKLVDSKYLSEMKISAETKQELDKIKTTSFLVLKDDTVLYEQYWGKHDKTTVSNSFSMAKSFVGILVGIAIDEGKIKGLDEKVGDILPAFKKGDLYKVTLRNLLTMSSGLSWSESGANPFSNNAEGYYGTELEELVLSQKLVSEPGKVFNYQSGNTELLALVVEKATGKTVSQYLYEKIWSKIGTEHDAYWSLDHENGHEKAFCCFYATTRDFAKLGLLILHNGVSNGEQIIPAWYFEELFKNEPMNTAENVPNTRYGLQWWTYKNIKYARGILGQYIVIMPELGMVVVRTGKKRMKNYTVPENEQNNAEKLAEDNLKLGHPLDLFIYIKTAKSLKNQFEQHK